MRSYPQYWTTFFTKLGLRRKQRSSQSIVNCGRKLRFEQCEDRRMLAMITVNDPGDFLDADPNITTLREAIVAANANPDTDTILFDSTLSGDTITLTQGQFYLYGPVIIDATNQGIPPDITIDANDLTPNDGNGDGSRIFNILGIPGEEYEINGLTLKGGDPQLEGGAIRSEDANLTLRNTTITGNKGSDGGGLYFKGYQNNLTMISSIISNNSLGFGGDRGGGAFITGTDSSIVISDTTFSDNTLDRTQGNGGGMFLTLTGLASSVVISDTTFLRNRALGDATNGGGMFLDVTDSNVVLDRLQVLENETDDDGGGLFLMNSGDGELRLRNSTVTGNTARDGDNGGSTFGGGGGLSIGSSGEAETIIEYSTIAFNEASGSSGGGIFIETSSQTPIKIENTTISGNHAGRDGGGIRFSSLIDGGSVNILHSTITNNRANSDEDTTGDGGGIYRVNSSTTATLDHTIVAGNFNEMGTTRDDIVGAVTIAWSLIGDDSGATITEEVGTVNQIGTSSSPVDADLGPLQPNGGPTETHAPQTSSLAVDAGDPNFMSPPLHDQRGDPFNRVDGGQIDIGAVELQPLADFDIDTDVDGIDFLAWQRGFGMTNASKADGDADNDQDVDAVDLAIWQSQYGLGSGSAAASSSPPSGGSGSSSMMMQSSSSLPTENAKQGPAEVGSQLSPEKLFQLQKMIIEVVIAMGKFDDQNDDGLLNSDDLLLMFANSRDDPSVDVDRLAKEVRFSFDSERPIFDASELLVDEEPLRVTLVDNAIELL